MVLNIGTKGRLLHYLHYTLNQNTCLNCDDPEPLVSNMSIHDLSLCGCILYLGSRTSRPINNFCLQRVQRGLCGLYIGRESVSKRLNIRKPMTHWNILIRIPGDNTLDCGAQLFEKCFVVIELCLLVLELPTSGFGPVGKFLNFCKFQHNSMHDTVYRHQALHACRNRPGT